MQVELLRDLINQAIQEPNEQIRIGNFWCFAPDYDDEVPIFRAIFFSDNVVSIECDELVIIKSENEFLIFDRYGGEDRFTYDEVKLLIYLWEESFKVETNVIKLDQHHDWFIM